jgi:hypothetical protein
LTKNELGFSLATFSQTHLATPSSTVSCTVDTGERPIHFFQLPETETSVDSLIAINAMAG